MVKQSKSLTTDFVYRPGEGFQLDTERRHIVGVDGRTSVRVAFRLSDAPAPDRRYLADVFGLVPSVGGYRLLFGQERIGAGGLRSLVVIDMTHDAVDRFMRTTGTLGSPGEDFLKYDRSLDKSTAIGVEPEQTVALKANVVLAAYSGGEACLDFYQVSPFSAHAANNGAKISLSPIVRIELRSGQLLGLLSELEALGFVREDNEESK